MYNSIHMQLVCSVCIEAVYQAVLTTHLPSVRHICRLRLPNGLRMRLRMLWMWLETVRRGRGGQEYTKWGPQTIAELVIITPKALVYDTFTVTIVTGVISYKPTYNCRGAHCRCSDAFSLSKVWGTLGTLGDWCLWWLLFFNGRHAAVFYFTVPLGKWTCAEARVAIEEA